ncbi:MAG: NF038122 family metalloprotease [Pseudomonadota bacterium]|jgi:hypothetical protein|nr:NF038122 family metalloprotease [Pseudomonadota bacterium]
MKFKSLLCGGAAMLALATSGGANAATIVLVDQGGVAGSPAAQGFAIAAAYWGSVLSNNITIRLGVGFAPLPTGAIGSTRSYAQDYSVAKWEAGVNATKSNSTTDAGIVLPTLTNGAAAFITNGPNVGQFDINTNTLRYDNQTTGADAINNTTLYLNTANVKAIGGTVAYDASNTQQLDGNVQFSSTFGFDFNPTDGIEANTFDFIGVAIHEIGHALGFHSGVDILDYYGGPNGGGIANGNTYNFDQTSIFSALDMFRYSNDPTNLVAGTESVLDLSVGGTKFFSVDGGLTALAGNTFSTGSYNGDGNQASHWKDATGANACGPQLGIMDPTICYGQRGEITALDLAAFDAIGYNLAVSARGANYLVNTAQIYNQFAVAVPEPATWAMMVMGFALVGGAMRRRKVSTTVSFS